MKKIAINGLGRIGKQFLIASLNKKLPFEFVINTHSELDSIVYDLKHDSVHPPIKEEVKIKEGMLIIGKRKIKVYNELDPEKLPWKKEGIDLVIECTGNFTDREGASKHLKAGAKKVLISAPAKNPDKTIVLGVNENTLNSSDKIISCASCTTNCVAPLIKILNDELKIKSAIFITTHAYTATQRVIDGSDKKDERRGRAAGVNIVPTTSGASQSVVEVIPELKGKVGGYALRIPVIDGSFASIVAQVESSTTKEKVNSLFKKYSNSKMHSLLEYSEEPLVSTDIINNPSSAIFDKDFTEVIGNQVSIGAWYDNELGYANRLAELASLIVDK